MFYLLETTAGLALFKEESQNTSILAKYKYKSTKEAIQMYSSISNNTLPLEFTNFISLNLPSTSVLNILNPEIAKTLSVALNVNVISKADNVFRALRKNSFKYFDISKDQFNSSNLKVAHKLINFNNEDVLIVDMFTSIEDLEKSINNRIMRAREWYSLHFPELSNISNNNLYLYYVLKIGNRSTFNCNSKESDQINTAGSSTNDQDIAISDEIIYQINNSMGCKITDDDMNKIRNNIEDINKDIEYKSRQCLLLKETVAAAFPNLFNLIGEVMTAKMIRKAGSITQLSQTSSSTIQIFGSEKAFNEAIKGQTNTPKYGVIYDSDIVLRAPDDLKGKVSRILANKISLCSRVDSNTKNNLDGSFGVALRVKVEKEIEKLVDRKNKIKKVIKNKKKKWISVKEYDTSKDVKAKKQ